MMLTWRNAKRLVVFIVGMTVVLVGVALIVLPGPAVVVIPVGLAILATEFVWAQRLLKKMKEKTLGAANSLGFGFPLADAQQKDGKDQSKPDGPASSGSQ